MIDLQSECAVTTHHLIGSNLGKTGYHDGRTIMESTTSFRLRRQSYSSHGGIRKGQKVDKLVDDLRCDLVGSDHHPASPHRITCQFRYYQLKELP